MKTNWKTSCQSRNLVWNFLAVWFSQEKQASLTDLMIDLVPIVKTGVKLEMDSRQEQCEKNNSLMIEVEFGPFTCQHGIHSTFEV